MIGRTLGSYEVVAKLGEGGMGEVWRARDTRLRRDVAIKVLPETFTHDPDRLTRFEREARALAALNHPNIAQIHGVIEQPPALVMECVEGEDVAELLRGGSLPLDDALSVARQVADALEAAHERGIVHRDLKPANVKVAPDGAVKVLDFGLAIDLGPAGVVLSAEAANSPTFTSPALTRAGVIVGTAAYLAPEQARGKVVDRRADIWAFGCLLFEMVTGDAPFRGDSITDLLSAIVSREPDWTRVPSNTPPACVALLRRCLEKDPRRRLRDIGEARVVLEGPIDPAVPGPADAPARSPRWMLPAALIVVGLLTVAVVVQAIAMRRTGGAATPPPLSRYDLLLPGAAVDVVFRPAVSVSADGGTFAFVGTRDGVEHIYVRTRGEAAPRLLPGTERGRNPSVSADGRWIAFFADNALRKASLDGGVTTVAAARDIRGITWVDAATLALTAEFALPLSIVPASGGALRTVTSLADGERTHRWAHALPGGAAVLFTAGTQAKPDTYDQSGIDVVVLATGERRRILTGAAMARYCGRGRLVYSKGSSLWTVPFDVERLQAPAATPVEIVRGVERDASTGAAHFDCSQEGTLVYVPGRPEGDLRQLAWMDRTGRQEAIGVPAGPYQEARISPDGGRIALLNGTSGDGDVWVHEIGAGTFTRLTFTGNCAAPFWSADGRTIYYTMFDSSGAASTIARKPADGSREAETLASVQGRAYVSAVNERAGAAIVDAAGVSNELGNIIRVPLAGGGRAEPLVRTPYNEFNATVSGDNRWLAYQSDETGRPEIYVVDLTGAVARRQLTSGGGAEPRWSADGRELYYRSANRLLAIPITATSTGLRAANPRPLFDGIYNSGIESGRSYDVARSGRFLLVTRTREPQATSTVRVVLNWDSALAPSSPR